MREICIDEQIKINGCKITTNNKIKRGNSPLIPDIWAKFYQSKLVRDVNFGVYFNYKNKYFDDYDLIIGSKNDEANIEFENVFIEKGQIFTFRKRR